MPNTVDWGRYTAESSSPMSRIGPTPQGAIGARRWGVSDERCKGRFFPYRSSAAGMRSAKVMANLVAAGVLAALRSALFSWRVIARSARIPQVSPPLRRSVPAGAGH
jgi:hypothetical protein